jgi:hypothetical protein
MQIVQTTSVSHGLRMPALGSCVDNKVRTAAQKALQMGKIILVDFIV